MQLSDHEIMAEVRATIPLVTPPPAHEAYQPASLDLRLGENIREAVPGAEMFPLADLKLEAGQFILAHTDESIALPGTLAAQVKGKSTWARRGLLVECAGFIDPGFEGQITLELKNLGHQRIIIPAGSYICQIAFYRMSSIPARMYGSELLNSHYQGQTGATPAAY